MVMVFAASREPVHEMEKVLFATDELTGTDLGSGADASVQECDGYGSFERKEEI